jgi:hypothetical protein
MVGKGAAISATKTKWTLECLLEDAKRFDSISEWMRSNSGAYDAAWRQGVVEQCTAHMQSKGGDNNVVYLWCDSLSSVYKIGITSDKLGMKRINMCRSHNKMDPRIVFMLKVDDARAVESELLKLGTDPELDSSIDGYTEFRKLTNTELGQAVSIAYEAALSAA